MFLDRMNPPPPQLQALAFACVGKGALSAPWSGRPTPKASPRPQSGPHYLSLAWRWLSRSCVGPSR